VMKSFFLYVIQNVV